MTMTVCELRETLESLQRDWPELGDARTGRERYIATSIDAGIAMLKVFDSGPDDWARQGFQRDETAEEAALLTTVREKALAVALGNYRLVCRLIDQDNFNDAVFRRGVVRETHS